MAQINADRLLDMGRNALYFEDYVVSIGYFNQVIEAKPHLTDPYFFRAIAKLYLEDYSGCIADCNSALEINPFLSKVYYLRGYAKRYIKDIDSSSDDLRKALEFDPENKEVHIVLIENLLQQNKIDDAYNEGMATIEKFPHYADTYILLTQVLLMKKDTVRAESVLDTGIKYNSDREMGYAIRGMLRYEKKDFKGALEDLNKAVKCNGFRGDFLVNRAIIKMELNDLKGALTDFDESIKLDNKNANAYYNRAILKAEIGDINNSIDDFSVSLALEPNNFAAYFQRAILHYKVGEYKEALADFNTVIKKYPDFVPAYMGRGDVKKKLKDTKGAEKDYFDAAQIEQDIKSGKRKQRQGDDTELEPTKEARAIVQNLNGSTAEKYKNEMRGHVQDKDIDIIPLPCFVVAVADSTAKTYRRQLHHIDIDKANMQLTDKLSFCLLDNVKTKIDFGGTTVVCTEPMCFFNRGSEKSIELKDKVANGGQVMVSDCISAINDLTMAYQLDNTIVYALYNIGFVYMVAKDFNSAIIYYTKAIEQYSGMAEAYYNRALIYISQGKKEEARKDLSKAGELGLYGAYNVMKRYAK
ncbi:MAG: tetratricopeptide repeat protein [Paludibacteraceae bacterium]|nr:tetratricopeptide repeat protein [Paludibacteraceae bacterium]